MLLGSASSGSRHGSGSSDLSLSADFWPENLAELSQPELVSLLAQHGAKVPVQHLSAVASAVASFSTSSAPLTVAQKRVFISDWFKQRMARRNRRDTPTQSHPALHPPLSARSLQSAGSADAQSAQSAESSEMSLRKLAPKLPPKGVPPPPRKLRGQSAPGSALSTPELDLVCAIARSKDAAGVIPTHLIPPLCERIVQLLGSFRAPPTHSGRRCLVSDWYQAALRRDTAAAATAAEIESSRGGACGRPNLGGSLGGSLGRSFSGGGSDGGSVGASDLSADLVRRVAEARVAEASDPSATEPTPTGYDESDRDTLGAPEQPSSTAAPPESAAAWDAAAATLCAQLEAKLGSLTPREVLIAAARVAALSGVAAPAEGCSLEEVDEYVGDWMRWRKHVVRAHAAHAAAATDQTARVADRRVADAPKTARGGYTLAMSPAPPVSEPHASPPEASEIPPIGRALPRSPPIAADRTDAADAAADAAAAAADAAAADADAAASRRDAHTEALSSSQGAPSSRSEGAPLGGGGCPRGGHCPSSRRTSPSRRSSLKCSPM